MKLDRLDTGGEMQSDRSETTVNNNICIVFQGERKYLSEI